MIAMYVGIQNRQLQYPFQVERIPINIMNTEIDKYYLCINKLNMIAYMTILTNLRRQVFSRNAPTHPAKLTTKTTPPAITITSEILRITSYTFSTLTEPVACHLSTNAYKPTPIRSPPNNCMII